MSQHRLAARKHQKKSDPMWGKSKKGLGVKNRWKQDKYPRVVKKENVDH